MSKRSNLSKRSFCYYIYMITVLAAVHTSCKKAEKRPDYPLGSNENINTWILDSLKRYYYWNENLTSNPNVSVSPQNFFRSLRDPSDRFSYLILPGVTTTAGNRDFGFDYTTVSDQTSSKIIGIVKMVLKDSPASRAGLTRGDYISKINGNPLTSANAQALQDEILNSTRFSMTLAAPKNNTWADTRTIEISKGIVLDQKEISRIMESNGKKIGYLFFIDFNPGLASSLTPVFKNFKTQGVSDLILDLRYNAGGQVAEAAGICAMIAQNITYDRPFITYKGNKNGGAKTESIGMASTFDRTANFNSLLQQNLSLSRVYVLSTSTTASAAEIIINNLKPFMQVIQIGEKTRGKDEASFRIFDARIPKQVNWEVHPIVYKLFNAQGNGAYSLGITPDVVINEMDTLPLLELGDPGDPLIKTAIARITGKTAKSGTGMNKALSGSFQAGNILLDSRLQSTRNSTVITHK